MFNDLFDVFVPSLAPHLNNGKVYDGNGFCFNRERLLNGILSVDEDLSEKVFSGTFCGYACSKDYFYKNDIIEEDVTEEDVVKENVVKEDVNERDVVKEDLKKNDIIEKDV